MPHYFDPSDGIPVSLIKLALLVTVFPAAALHLIFYGFGAFWSFLNSGGPSPSDSVANQNAHIDAAFARISEIDKALKGGSGSPPQILFED